MAAEQQSDEALRYGLLEYNALSLGSQTTNHQATFTEVTTYQTT